MRAYKVTFTILVMLAGMVHRRNTPPVTISSRDVQTKHDTSRTNLIILSKVSVLNVTQTRDPKDNN